MLYNDNDRKKALPRSSRYSKKGLKIKVIIIGIALIINIVSLREIDINYLNTKASSDNSNKNKFVVDGFMPLYTNNTKGPITTNRELDDGKKWNIYSRILENNEEDFNAFFYDNQVLIDLPEIIVKDEIYTCEILRPLENKGTILTCPEYYTITIDKAFFGRYAKDVERCQISEKFGKLKEEDLYNENDCGVDVINKARKHCEGKVRCNLKSNIRYFPGDCLGFNKYLHIKYHCVKDKEIKKPKFAVVMYSDVIKSNTIYEHAISDFYQYSDIHGYKFILNSDGYDDEREIYYMKLHVVLEAIVNGLKNKEYDWIFWVDSDTILANPNIKLETFLPKDTDVNLIISADHHGINAGVFLIRICSWSLNFISRAIAYQYHNMDKLLDHADQTSLNNVLLEGHEQKHYVIVPQNWFNNYPDFKHDGDMIIHLAGILDKDNKLWKIHNEIDDNEKYLTGKTNKSLRKEVLDYYNLPREKQGVTFIDNNNKNEKQH